MFKPGSGRKTESEVWKYFVYDSASDKSRCLVKVTEASSTVNTASCECGQLLIGKNATNLRNHIRSKHKSLNAELEKKEKEQKRPTSEKTTQLNLPFQSATAKVIMLSSFISAIHFSSHKHFKMHFAELDIAWYV